MQRIQLLSEQEGARMDEILVITINVTALTPTELGSLDKLGRQIEVFVYFFNLPPPTLPFPSPEKPWSFLLDWE